MLALNYKIIFEFLLFFLTLISNTLIFERNNEEFLNQKWLEDTNMNIIYYPFNVFISTNLRNKAKYRLECIM